MNSLLTAALILNWVLLLLIGVLVAGILRYLGAIHGRLEAAVPRVSALEKGQDMPDFELPGLYGGSLASSNIFGAGRRALLFVLNDQCQSCEVLAKQVGEVASRGGGLAAVNWQIVLAWIGDRQTIARKAAVLPRDKDLHVLIDVDGQLAKKLLVSTFPIGILVDGHGRVADQSGHPGPTWFYMTLGVPAPSGDLDDREWGARLRVRGESV